jgi:hypothetical protein
MRRFPWGAREMSFMSFSIAGIVVLILLRFLSVVEYDDFDSTSKFGVPLSGGELYLSGNSA